MTKEELKEFTTSLLDGREMNDTLFDTLLQAVKTVIEGERPWRKLATEDSSATVSSSDDYTDTKALPSDFRVLDGEKAVVLVAGDDVIEPLEIPFKSRHGRKDDPNRYFLDVKNNEIGFTGTRDGTYTLNLNYICFSPDIDDSNDWIFPSAYHPLLAHLIAAIEKGGIDYDDISARQLLSHSKEASLIFAAMVKWDAELARRAVNV